MTRSPRPTARRRAADATGATSAATAAQITAAGSHRGRVSLRELQRGDLRDRASADVLDARWRDAAGTVVGDVGARGAAAIALAPWRHSDVRVRRSTLPAGTASGSYQVELRPRASPIAFSRGAPYG